MFTAKNVLNKHQILPHLKKTHTKKHFNSLCLIEFNELLGFFLSFFFFFLEYVKGFYFNNWWTIECKELCKWNVKIGETVDSF